MVVMDQNLIDDDFSERGVNVDNPLRNTNNEKEKSNKCNQCEYASSVKSNFRRHLKTHSGEKSNKCNQCEYASSEAGHLRTQFVFQIFVCQQCFCARKIVSANLCFRYLCVIKVFVPEKAWWQSDPQIWVSPPTVTWKRQMDQIILIRERLSWRRWYYLYQSSERGSKWHCGIVIFVIWDSFIGHSKNGCHQEQEDGVTEHELYQPYESHCDIYLIYESDCYLTPTLWKRW